MSSTYQVLFYCPLGRRDWQIPVGAIVDGVFVTALLLPDVDTIGRNRHAMLEQRLKRLAERSDISDETLRRLVGPAIELSQPRKLAEPVRDAALWVVHHILPTPPESL